MTFKVGDKAVVPALGVGIIQSIGPISIGSETFEGYTINILDNGVKYTCPIKNTGANGVREVIPVEAVDKIYEVLADRNTPADKQTWNRRYREYTNKIKTGDPLEVAAVLRDLARLRGEKTLSFGERNMFEQAYTLIVQEVACAKDVDETVIKSELEGLFLGPVAEAREAGADDDELEESDDEEDDI